MTGHPPGDAPEEPPMPDYPPTPGDPPTPGYRDPGYPPTPGYRDPGYPPTPGYAPWEAMPSGPPSESTADEEWPPGEPAVAHDEYVRPLAGDEAQYGGGLADDGHEPRGLSAGGTGASPRPAARPVSAADVRAAALAYLTVPFFAFLPALVIYLSGRRTSPWARAHAAQAINVWITGILYDLSGAIMGAMLALDTPKVAVAVVMPAAVVLWLITLAFLVRAAGAASRGEEYSFPRWLCTPIAR